MMTLAPWWEVLLCKWWTPARAEQAVRVQLRTWRQSRGRLDVQGGTPLSWIRFFLKLCSGHAHDTNSNTNTVILLIITSIPLLIIETKVGFPGLMSCVDFDMAQSSRYVGLCGILPISHHDDNMSLNPPKTHTSSPTAYTVICPL